MKNSKTTDTYTARLEQRLAVLTAERDSLRGQTLGLSQELQDQHRLSARLSSERDSLREEAGVLSEELQALRSSADRLASERDNLAGVVEKMRDELRQLRRMLFGRKSERFIPSDPSQLKLDFEGEAELPQEREYAALQKAAPVARKETAPRIERPTEERQRRIFSEHLERRDEIIEPAELPAESRRIGEEITELLEYKPGEFYIRRLIRPKYALPNGDGVVIGDLPSLPLARTNAGASILAQLLVGKYQDHLPLHRQIGIFSRAGVQLKASTVSDWVQGAAELLEPLYECLRKRVLSCDYIQIDETTIPVLDKDKPGATRKGYHWVVRSPELKSLFFHYDKGSRAQYVAVELLKDFRGAVQSDGYGAYDIYENKQGVLLLGCWAHIRRKFEHALTDDPQRAEYALRVIGELYAIERRVKERGLPPDEVKLIREKEAYPLIKEFEKWIEHQTTSTAPQSSIGKAVRYAYALYPRMARYVTDGRYRIDNNLAENAVRPLALGRKNYLFCRNHQAAYHTAVVYSLLGTCRLWGLDPVRWLTDVCSRIQDCSVKRLEELLPHRWKPQD